MSKNNSSIHNWFGTIAAVITIFAWLTGIHSINFPKSRSIVELTFSNNTFGVILLILSHLIVWAAFSFFTLAICRHVYLKSVFIVPVLVIFSIIGYCIELILYDAFFDASKTVFISLIQGNISSNSGFTLGELFIVFFPAVIVSLIGGMLKLFCCKNCGKLSLEFVSRENLEPFEEREYLTLDSKPIVRVKRYQKYKEASKCKSCGTNWISHGSCYLGFHNYDC